MDRTELHPDYRNNPRELDKIVSTINLVKNDKNVSITGVEIHGYASPEAPYDYNARLAEARAKTLTDHVRRLVDLDRDVFKVTSTPEDWEGLRQALREGNLENRDAILAIAEDESLEPDAREWRIKKNYPKQYRFMLDNYYPALRHSDYVVSYTVRPFSVEEAKEVFRTNPKPEAAVAGGDVPRCADLRARLRRVQRGVPDGRAPLSRRPDGKPQRRLRRD